MHVLIDAGAPPTSAHPGLGELCLSDHDHDLDQCATPNLDDYATESLDTMSAGEHSFMANVAPAAPQPLAAQPSNES